MSSRLPAGALEIAVADERLWLLPQRAAYWPRTSTLLVADAHLGKAAAFRREGVPVPSGTTEENLEALTSLIASLGARRVIFLGDMLHNRAGREATTKAFTQWRSQHAEIEMLLVRGNHDKRAGDPPFDWQVDCVNEPHVVETLALVHTPQTLAGTYAIGGHVHPAVTLAGRGREHLRLPCFFFRRDYAILPAFGSFTGMADVDATEGDGVYVVADSRVIQV